MAIPRTSMPDRYAREYFREVRRLLEVTRRQIRKAFQDEIRPRIHEHRALLTSLADGGHSGTSHTLPFFRVNSSGSKLRVNDAMDEITRVLQRLRDSTTTQVFATPILERFIRQFVTSINESTKVTFRRQTMRILGFDPTANDMWLRSTLETAVQENISWIKSIAVEYHDKVDTIVMQGVRRGASINDIAKQIAEVGDVSMRRARFIARDQLGSLHGDLTKIRHQNIGLTSFRWRTSQDEKVRDSHENLEGKVYTWAEGARNERGEKIWPGTDYNCRCVAETLEEELLEIAEEVEDSA